jgi:ketosteroid isomerase-like protein
VRNHVSAEDRERRLRAILGELESGMVQGSAADVFERYTAPDYIFTSPSGELSTRESILAGLREGSVRFTSYTMSDIEVRLYGGVAVVIGRAEGDGVNPGGEPFHGAHRFTSVWSSVDLEWKLVAWQTTVIARNDGATRNGTA